MKYADPAVEIAQEHWGGGDGGFPPVEEEEQCPRGLEESPGSPRGTRAEQ